MPAVALLLTLSPVMPAAAGSIPARSEAGSAATPADAVEFWLESDVDGRVLEPGQRVLWLIRGRATGPNRGLAAFSVDLVQAEGNPAPLDILRGASPIAGLEGFDSPAGFTNPWPGDEEPRPPGASRSGYGGTPRPRPDGGMDLVQIGGAQNTFGLAPACPAPGDEFCQGQQVDVQAGVAQDSAGAVLAEGMVQAPEAPGVYLLRLARPRAGVLASVAEPPQPSTVRAATVSVPRAEISFEVAGPGGEASVAAASSRPPETGPPATATMSRIVHPAPGSVLTRTHVRFWWPAVAGARGYRLRVYPEGEEEPVVDVEVDAAEPRHTVTEGLMFGSSYAWQVTARVGPQGHAAGFELRASAMAPREQAGPWRRFAIAPLPDEIPAFTVDRPEAGPLEPGYTLFNLGTRSRPPAVTSSLAVAADLEGRIVLFVQHPDDRGRGMGLVELRDHGRLLMLRRRSDGLESANAVHEETLDGRPVWISAAGRGYQPHHDADILPDGDLLLLLKDPVFLPEDQGRERIGDRLVVVDRQTGRELWQWRTVEHYALEDGNVDLENWTHGNAVFYAPSQDSVYYSARRFSWVTRIDFTSGDIIYNMGAHQPSGRDDFGDGFFRTQHDPSLLDSGNLLVFDNNRNLSYVKEIAFDDPVHPSDGAVVWEQPFEDPAGEPIWVRFAGGAQRLANGNTLYSAGTHGRIQEIDPDGRLLWSLRFGAGDPEHVCYRAQRVSELIRDVPGDSDGDQDLDLADLLALMVRAGMEAEPSAGLAFPDRLSDMNGDGSLDAVDMAEHVSWRTGPVD